MNLLELKSGLEDGTLIVDDSGHCFNKHRYIEDIQNKIDRKPESATLNYSNNEKIYLNDRYCFYCGGRLYPTLTHTGLSFEPCQYVLAPTTATIVIQNKLVFANYFDLPDTPEGKEYLDEYSLNCLLGQANRTAYKASINVAFGQMGNMSLDIYVNQSKDRILLGQRYYDDDEEAEFTQTFEGFSIAGSICCEVWRWEAADSSSPRHTDGIEIDSPGTWKFTHYYSTDTSPNKFIYAEFEKVTTQ